MSRPVLAPCPRYATPLPHRPIPHPTPLQKAIWKPSLGLSQQVFYSERSLLSAWSAGLWV